MEWEGNKIKQPHTNYNISVYEISKEVNDEVEKVARSANFIIKSTWLIINTDWKWCKWYCMWDNNIPNICNKWGSCINYKRASETLKRIDDFNREETLRNIY